MYHYYLLLLFFLFLSGFVYGHVVRWMILTFGSWSGLGDGFLLFLVLRYPCRFLPTPTPLDLSRILCPPSFLSPILSSLFPPPTLLSLRPLPPLLSPASSPLSLSPLKLSLNPPQTPPPKLQKTCFTLSRKQEYKLHFFLLSGERDIYISLLLFPFPWIEDKIEDRIGNEKGESRSVESFNQIFSPSFHLYYSVGVEVYFFFPRMKASVFSQRMGDVGWVDGEWVNGHVHTGVCYCSEKKGRGG